MDVDFGPSKKTKNLKNFKQVFIYLFYLNSNLFEAYIVAI